MGLYWKRWLLALPVLILVAFLLVPYPVRERMSNLFNPQDVTIQTRLCKWKIGLRLIRAYPWTGVGMDGIQSVYPAYRDPQDPVACGDRHLGHLDNNLLQIAVERGLIGLVCWLSIWGVYLRHVWAISRRLSAQARQAKAFVVSSLTSV